MHQYVENLVGDVQRSFREGLLIPEAPRDAPFRVSAAAASIEGARPALADAKLFRETSRASVSEPTSSLETIQAGAERLSEQYNITSAHRDASQYVDANEPPSSRSIEGTPAGELYRMALELADEQFFERRRGRLQPANRCLRAAVGLAGIETFSTVVEKIRAGESGVPNSVTPIVKAYDDAVAALRIVRGGAPQRLRIELDWPAREVFDYQMSEVHEEVTESEGGEVSTSLVSDVYGGLVHTYYYATCVPPAADHLVSVLQEA
ncbi:MAG: hypothetical protein ABEI27_01550 [Halobellus sp.]|uniref:hypothetical protein n=1 Tax=Halobellus sp. TaxID=1979212 RepID=UPI0035D4B81F